jgi:hypothetical protein
MRDAQRIPGGVAGVTRNVPLPDDVYAVLSELGITSDDRDAVDQRLRDQQAVERVSVKVGERSDGQDVVEPDRMNRHLQLAHAPGDPSVDRLRQRELSASVLDRHLPDIPDADDEFARGSRGLDAAAGA